MNDTLRPPDDAGLTTREAAEAARLGAVAREASTGEDVVCVLLYGDRASGFQTGLVIDRAAHVAARIRDAQDDAYSTCQTAWSVLSPRFGPGLVVDLQGHVWSFVVGLPEDDDALPL